MITAQKLQNQDIIPGPNLIKQSDWVTKEFDFVQITVVDWSKLNFFVEKWKYRKSNNILFTSEFCLFTFLDPVLLYGLKSIEIYCLFVTIKNFSLQHIRGFRLQLWLEIYPFTHRAFCNIF